MQASSSTSSDRKQVSSHRTIVAAALLLALASCGDSNGTKKAPAAMHPKLPMGVAWKPGNQHCPGTSLEETEKGYKLSLKFSLEEDELHTIEELKLLGPSPDFVLLQGKKLEAGVLGKQQVFALEKTQALEEMDHLLVVLRCKQHGAYGVAQAFFRQK